MDMYLEEIKIRVEAIRDAIKRSRLAFLVANIASASIVAVAWNAYLSWDRWLVMTNKCFAPDPVTAEAQRGFLRMWVQGQVVSVSLLGIRIAVSDLSFIGSIALFVVMAWSFHATRKENHLIGVLLRDSKKRDMGDPDLRRLIYHGVSAYLVFVKVTEDDTPIRSLTEGRQDEATAAVNAARKLLARNSRGRTLWFLRPATTALTFVPAFVIIFLITMDVLTIYPLQAAFRVGHPPLWSVVNGWRGWAKFAFMEGVAVLFSILTYALCKRCSQFNIATRNVLREYEQMKGLTGGGNVQLAA